MMYVILTDICCNTLMLPLVLLSFILSLVIVKIFQTRTLKSMQQKLLQQVDFDKQELKKLNESIDLILEKTEKTVEENSTLERGNMIKDKLLSVISHDLRSPISSLQVLLNLFNTNNLPQKELFDFIGKMLSRVENAATMLTNLLQWSQSQLSGIKPIFSKVDIQSIIDDSMSFYLMQAEQKHITIDNSSKLSAFVTADIEMLKIILRNLISNALKFTFENGTITLKAVRQDKEVIVSVKDTGMGVSEENMAKMFAGSNFTTLGTGKEKGTGLGLMLCKDFVEHNRGKIWLESKEGEGTTFYFSLSSAD
jgi:signal transduction histidine kinase